MARMGMADEMSWIGWKQENDQLTAITTQIKAAPACGIYLLQLFPGM